MAGQVEVGVVGQVAVGGLVSGGLVADGQVAVVIPGVGDVHVQVAGVVLLHVGGEVVQLHAVKAFALGGFGQLPQLGVEAFRTAVEVVGVVVDGQVVLRAVQGEVSLGDAVAVSAHDVAHEGMVALVAVQGFKAQGDVRHLAVLVRHDDGGDDGAQLDHRDGSADLVGHGEHGDCVALLGDAKRLGNDGHGNSPPYCIAVDSIVLRWRRMVKRIPGRFVFLMYKTV